MRAHTRWSASCWRPPVKRRFPHRERECLAALPLTLALLSIRRSSSLTAASFSLGPMPYSGSLSPAVRLLPLWAAADAIALAFRSKLRIGKTARLASLDPSIPGIRSERMDPLMKFDSILFPSEDDRPPSEAIAQPDFFVDLNLNQVVAAITVGKKEYNLTPFFHWPLRNVDAVLYRHEVMRDLEDDVLFDNIKTFASALHLMRETLEELEKRHYQTPERGAVSRRC